MALAWSAILSTHEKQNKLLYLYVLFNLITFCPKKQQLQETNDKLYYAPNPVVKG